MSLKKNTRLMKSCPGFSELKKNGIFPSGAQTPVAPEPPRKKQKVGHHANNQASAVNHKHGRTHIFFNSNHEYGGSNKNKHNGMAGAKAWKPKRPVPASRKVPGKLLLDEGGDLPRGRHKGETAEVKKAKKMKMKTKKANRAASAPSDGRTNQDCPGWRDRTPNSDSKQERKKRKKKLQKMKIAEKRLNSPMYPRDENLFMIKQRRGRRR